MRRRFAFLVNPASGGGVAGQVVVPLARALRDAGADVAVRYTTSIEETPHLVAAAVAQDRIVVAVGGDGMLSSVAGAVADVDGVLAVVPAGRGNDFARMLRLPKHREAQVRLLLHRGPRPIDLLDARLPGQPVRCVAGAVHAGVDAHAVAMVNRAEWVPDRLQYPVAAMRALADYRPAAVTLEVDGARSTHRAATVVVANSGYYGKGMRIAPEASMVDGQLDVVVIEADSRREVLRALPSVYDGSHADRDGVHLMRGRSIRLAGSQVGGGAVPVGADGEPLGELPPPGGALEVDVRPGAVRVLV